MRLISGPRIHDTHIRPVELREIVDVINVVVQARDHGGHGVLHDACAVDFGEGADVFEVVDVDAR